MKETSFNYIYFGLILFFLLSTSFCHLYSLPNIQQIRSYFLLDGLLQSSIETIFLILTSFLIQRFWKRGHLIFILLSFFLFVLHVADFILIRVMDMSVWEGIQIPMGESLENFLEMLETTSIPLYLWGIFGLCALALPFIGFGLYYLTDYLSKKKPFTLSLSSLLQLLFYLPMGLLFWDLNSSSLVTNDIYHFYQKSLPWKGTISSQKTQLIPIGLPLKKTVEHQPLAKLKEKPNIYLFIVESLREDFITKEIAPSILSFKKENIFFDLSLSNANATQLSWFSIFHSCYPFYWSSTNKKEGSLPLKLLKESGYEIHVYTAAHLNYYKMQELLFGENLYLTDSFHFFPHHSPKPPWKADEEVFSKLTSDLENPENHSGRIFICFLDSTHFDYSWPEYQAKKFLPVASEGNCFSTYPTKFEIELIKNRYKNAVYYIDSLFGKFLNTVKTKNLYEKSILIFVGDHGEEFFEEGNLFHASHLSHVQTHIPLYYKFGDNTKKVAG